VSFGNFVADKLFPKFLGVLKSLRIILYINPERVFFALNQPANILARHPGKKLNWTLAIFWSFSKFSSDYAMDYALTRLYVHTFLFLNTKDHYY
jgi:hypothetical protein